jgi:hypothetical protein
MKKTFLYTGASHTENTEEEKILKGFPCTKNMSINEMQRTIIMEKQS